MAESLASFLIELGVSTGPSLRKIEEIEKKITDLGKSKGLNKELKVVDQKISAAKRVAKVESEANRAFLRDANARVKIHKMWETDKQQSINAIRKAEREAHAENQAREKAAAAAYKQRIKDRLNLHRLSLQFEKDSKRQLAAAEREAHAENKARDAQKAQMIKQRIAMQKAEHMAYQEDARRTARIEAENTRKRIQQTRQSNDIVKKRMRLLETLSMVTNEGLREEVELLKRSAREWNGNSVELLKYQQRAKRLAREQKNLNREMRRGSWAAQGFKDSLNNLGRSYLSVFAVISGGSFALRTTKEFETMQNMLVAVTGDTASAGEEFERVKNKAIELGVAIKPAVEGFAKLSIAGKDMFSAEEINEVFLAVTESATAFGLSADDANGAFRAFQQMIGKGKITAEELRQQLGERIFTAFTDAVEAAGVTFEEFDKMLQRGEVSLDLLPKMAAQMRRTAREGGLLEKQMNSLNAAQNRMIGRLQESVTVFADAGFRRGVSNLFESISRGLKAAEPLFEALGQIARPVLTTIGVAIELIGEFAGGVVKAVKWVTGSVKSLVSTLTVVGGAILGGKLMAALTGITMGAGKAGKAIKALRLIFLPFGLVLAKFAALGFLVIGIFDEIANIFRSDENKKIGMFSAPEGYEAGWFDIQDTFENLFKWMEEAWGGFTSLFEWDTWLTGFTNMIGGAKKLWQDFLVWAGLREPEEGQANPAAQRRQSYGEINRNLELDKIRRDMEFAMNAPPALARELMGPAEFTRMTGPAMQTPNRSSVTHNQYDIQVNGSDNPAEVAREVIRRIDETDRRRNTGDLAQD